MEIAEGIKVGLPGIVLAIVGVALMSHIIRKRLRRLRSLRQSEDGIYHWTEIDGTPRASRVDPRDSWSSDNPDIKGDPD
jgi:hypothetical protein